MIDRAAIEAGKAAMKLELTTRRVDGRIQYLGAYSVVEPAREMSDVTEIEGSIDVGELAEAFMRGAGIREVSDVSRLQDQVEALRDEVAEMRATMRLVPRQPAPPRFVGLSGAPIGRPPSGGPTETKE